MAKKKIRKNIGKAIAHVNATFNNTLITITDLNGETLAWDSAGTVGFKGARKATPFAATRAAERVASKVKRMGVREVEVRVNGRLSLNGAVAAVSAAKAGLGVACSPRWAAVDALERGEVIDVLADWAPEHRFLWAVFPSNRYMTHRVRAFVDYLAKRFDGVV